MRPRPPRLLAVSALAALIASLSSAALAAPSGKDRADARALVTDARKAMKDKRWADALSALKKAERLDPTPALSVELAQAQVAAGKLVEAQRTLASVVAGTDPAPTAKRARDAAKKDLDDLKARVPTVKLVVTGPPAGQVTMLVDGIEVEGDEIPLDPGNHTIGAEAKGYASAEKEVYLGEGERQELPLRLVARDAAKGKDQDRDRKGSRVPGAVVTSVGAAGLLVGGIFGGLAFQATSSAKALCKDDICPGSASGAVSRATTFGNVATGMLVAGGAVAVTGVVLILVAPGGKPDEAPKSASARVSPWVGPGGAGLAAAGTF
jgi:hypothetical protein